jgi:hypothetical protein
MLHDWRKHLAHRDPGARFDRRSGRRSCAAARRERAPAEATQARGEVGRADRLRFPGWAIQQQGARERWTLPDEILIEPPRRMNGQIRDGGKYRATVSGRGGGPHALCCFLCYMKSTEFLRSGRSGSRDILLGARIRRQRRRGYRTGHRQ